MTQFNRRLACLMLSSAVLWCVLPSVALAAGHAGGHAAGRVSGHASGQTRARAAEHRRTSERQNDRRRHNFDEAAAIQRAALSSAPPSRGSGNLYQQKLQAWQNYHQGR